MFRTGPTRCMRSSLMYGVHLKRSAEVLPSPDVPNRESCTLGVLALVGCRGVKSLHVLSFAARPVRVAVVPLRPPVQVAPHHVSDSLFRGRARARTSRRSSRAACSHPLDTLAAPCRHRTRRRPVPGPRTRARGDIPAICRTHACSSGLYTPRTARGCWLHFLLCRAVAPLALCNQLPSLFLLNCCTVERPGSGRFTRCTEAMPVGD